MMFLRGVWTIAQREFSEQFRTVRFGVAILALSGLMIVNALKFAQADFSLANDEFSHKTNFIRDQIEGRAIYELAFVGPGSVYKRPSPFWFMVDKGDVFPNHVDLRSHGGTYRNRYFWQDLWDISYPLDYYGKGRPRLGFERIDWVSTIGILGSLLAIFLAHGSISGEREDGTLLLVLSHSVSRATFITGKYLGSLCSIGLLTSLAITINLTLIFSTSDIQIPIWPELSLAFLASIAYLSVFTLVGILVSTRTHTQTSSLLISVLCWIVLTMVLPSGVSSMASRLKESRSVKATEDAIESELAASLNSFSNRGLWESTPKVDSSIQVLTLWAEFIADQSEIRTKLNTKLVDSQLRQLHFGRQVSRLSPKAEYEQILEAIAAVGYPAHLEFLRQARRFSFDFRSALASMDLQDAQSNHIHFVREGLSAQAARIADLPIFESRQSPASPGSILEQLSILLLWNGILFGAALASFERSSLVPE